MNKQRLEELAQWLETGAQPKGNVIGYNQKTWDTYKPVGLVNSISIKEWIDYGAAPETECGSVCCIAGATTQFFLGKSFHSLISPVEKARDALGLDQHQARQLFTGGPDVPSCAYIGSHDNKRINPKYTARVIRHLIKTGEVNWSTPSCE